MNDYFSQQIFNELNLRETDDLLDIWQENNREQWSDEAFSAIREILNRRGVELPKQDKPVYSDDDKPQEDYEFSDEELRIIDDVNPPDFYDPFEVLKLSRWIDLAIKAMIGLIVIQSLLNISTYWRISQSYFTQQPNSIGVYVFTLVILAVNIALAILLTYIPLKALSKILRILMEMEFRSRKQIQ